MELIKEQQIKPKSSRSRKIIESGPEGNDMGKKKKTQKRSTKSRADSLKELIRSMNP